MSESQADQLSFYQKANTNYYSISSQLPEKTWNQKLPPLLAASANALLQTDLPGIQQQVQDLSTKSSQNSHSKITFNNQKKTLCFSAQNQLNQFKFGEKIFGNQNNNNEEKQEKKNKVALFWQMQKKLNGMNKDLLSTNTNTGLAKQSQQQQQQQQQNNDHDFNNQNDQIPQFQYQYRQLKNFTQETKQKLIEKQPTQQSIQQQAPLLTKKIIPTINFHKQSYFQQLCATQNNKDNNNNISKGISTTTQLFSPNNVITIKKISPSKMSGNKNGIINAFAANTHQGIIRKSNEDRVSIVLNIKRPENKQTSTRWPKCFYFAIFDGHGGTMTAQFLKDNLHQYIIKDSEFPENPKQAIINGFTSADNYLIQQATNLLKENKKEEIDLSGSCAIVLLIIANLGDSRAILSSNTCTLLTSLSSDHKPMLETEFQRIIKAGGKIYQNTKFASKVKQEIPFRIMPSRLNVSRTIGDVASKISEIGGVEGVIISIPDVFTLPYQPSQDFIFLGSDGIFDRVSSELILRIANKSWENNQESSVHEKAAKMCENVIKEAVARRSADNLTAVLVVLGLDVNVKKNE